MKKQHPLLIRGFTALTALSRGLLSLRYKVNLKGTENLKNGSPMLILPNHPALIDPVILISHIYRYTHSSPVITSTFYDIPVLKSIFSGMGAVRVSDLGGGSRNVNVLNDITRAVLKGFRRGKKIVLYPGGQLAAQGSEKVFNKKSAHKIVSKIPNDVKVIGIRTTGLWGSMWSKARTGKTPNLVFQVLKGAFFILANLFFFLPRRTVTIEIKDLTAEAKEKAVPGRKTFNSFLENYYNLNGDESPSFVSYFFLAAKQKGN